MSPHLTQLRALLDGQLDANPDAVLLVTLEDFFTENDDLGSIGCNLIDHPGIPAFRDTFMKVRSRESVAEVLVQISDLNGEGEWPFSDTVYVVTAAPVEEVRSWVSGLQPDEVRALDDEEVREYRDRIPAGMKALAVWWD